MRNPRRNSTSNSFRGVLVSSTRVVQHRRDQRCHIGDTADARHERSNCDGIIDIRCRVNVLSALQAMLPRSDVQRRIVEFMRKDSVLNLG